MSGREFSATHTTIRALVCLIHQMYRLKVCQFLNFCQVQSSQLCTFTDLKHITFMQTSADIQLLNEKIQYTSLFVDRLRQELSKVIIGQQYMVDRLLIGLLSNGHVLLEGVPGLAKTLTIKSLAQAIDAKFSRIQFTPDLLPADVIGTMIYNQSRNEFMVRKGPIFANFILADEINRAPAKVQSALLEAMQEKQVTISEHTYKLE
jgi:MoxR-like ATPase